MDDNLLQLTITLYFYHILHAFLLNRYFVVFFVLLLLFFFSRRGDYDIDRLALSVFSLLLCYARLHMYPLFTSLFFVMIFFIVMSTVTSYYLDDGQVANGGCLIKQP